MFIEASELFPEVPNLYEYPSIQSSIEEGMVEVINDAKRRFLKPGGRLIPQMVSLRAAPAFHPDFYQQYIDAWEKPVYNLNFSFWRERSLQTPWATEVTPEKLITSEQEVTGVDFLQGINPQEDNHNYFLAKKVVQTNGVGFWFEAQLSDHVHLSSAPGTPTHWKQCFAPISQPFSVSPGDIIEVVTKMGFRTQKDNHFTFTWTAEKV